jgi:hypothetical protein
MHFGRVKIGDRYSVSPEATLGPIQEKWAERDKEREQSQREASNQEAIS